MNDTHIAGLANLLVKVALPCTVFMSMMRPFSRDLLVEALVTFFIAGVFYIVGGYLGLLVGRVMGASDGERQSWRFGAAFPNVAFMGIPVVAAVYGADGIIYVSMAIAAWNLLAFTHGARMFDHAPRNVNIKAVFLNTPALVAVFVGFAFFLTGLRLPAPVEGGIAMVGGLTTPVSMIIIGTILAKQKLKDALIDIRVLPAVFLRLILLPLVCFFILKWLISNQLMLHIIVMLVAMPVAALAAVFAEQFKADSAQAAKYIVVSTLLSAVTLPGVLMVMSIFS